MSTAASGFLCGISGMIVMTAYTVANCYLRRRGVEAVWIGGWVVGAAGMSLIGLAWVLLCFAGPHYTGFVPRILGFALSLGSGALYFSSAVHVGRLRTRERFHLDLYTDGIYGRIRHPQALALCILAVGLALLSLSRPFLLSVPLWVGFWIAYTYFEERFELIPAYGDEYRRYIDRTGRIFPKL